MKRLALFSTLCCGLWAQRLPEIPVDAPKQAADDRKWRIVYFHDQDDSEFIINDLKFTSAERGIAVGFRLTKQGKVKPMAVATRDGGERWTEVPLKDPALSLFALDDQNLWVVSEKRLWYSAEGGLGWVKRSLPKNTMRVHFLDPRNGFAIGAGKTAWRTADGGAAWQGIPESTALPLTTENCAFHWIDFVNPRVGVMVGHSQRPERPSESPSWMDPEKAAMKRPLPSTTMMLETRDAGATWKSQVASTFGTIRRMRMRGAAGLALFNYPDGLDWPAEIVVSDLTTGKNRPLYRRKNRNVTDLLFREDGSILLAAIEPPGKLLSAPLPGKLRMIESPDGESWTEMDVDYKAQGKRAMLASAGSDFWVATDNGMILKLRKKAK